MCGDDEDAGELEEALYAGFLAHARVLLAPHGDTDAKAAADDPLAYMDKLFADALSRCVKDGAEAPASRAYQRLTAQPLVFARLAGLIAGHLGLERDPLRKVIEVLMQGYGEAQARQAERHAHGHEHDDEHDHQHGHDHGHGHHY
jgi:hypothetical protein